MKNDNLKNQYRINEQIRVREVRIVGDNGSTVVPTRDALNMAREQGVDLVEISPNANPPVCRLIDYSKFLYQQKKRQKEMKAKQVKVEVKEIRFGPQTDEHDYQFKLKHAKEFLEEGNKVRAYVFFRGRSILFKEQGEVLLLRFANDWRKWERLSPCPRSKARRCSSTSLPRRPEPRSRASRPAIVRLLLRKSGKRTRGRVGRLPASMRPAQRCLPTVDSWPMPRSLPMPSRN